jgi:hypothetical protein
MKVISFKTALKLAEKGFHGKSEMVYIYQVVDKKVVKKKGKKTITETWEEWNGDEKSVHLHKYSHKDSHLSDRFYDSWTDSWIPAYNALELLKLFKDDKMIGANADPEKLAKELL